MKIKEAPEALMSASKLHLRLLLVLPLSVFSWTAAYAQITPSEDSYTNSAEATTNYGANVLLNVDGATQISYIRFNLASIPAGASVSQATLKLYVNAVTTAGSFNVDYVNGAWAESTITSDLAPALGATIVSSVPITKADKNQYILINVTPAVEAWLSGSEANDGIALVANSTFNASFDSKENTTTSHPAELDIVFAGDGTITGVATASGSGLIGGGTSGTLNLGLTKACASSQVLQWNGSAWECSSAGTGTITGVTAGTNLTGGGTSGKVTLSLNTTATNALYAQLAAANTFAPQQVIKGNGGNAIIGDPGCGSGFAGIGLTSSTLSGCVNYTLIGKSSGDVYVNSTSTGSIHFRNNNDNGDLVSIDNSGDLSVIGQNGGGNLFVSGSMNLAGEQIVNNKEIVSASNSSEALFASQSGSGSGVVGSVTASTGATAGVLGTTTSAGTGTEPGGYGVEGASPNVGVYGVADGSSGVAGSGAGVWGDTGGGDTDACEGCYVAVLGTAGNTTAGAFGNTSNLSPTLSLSNGGTGGTGAAVLETRGSSGTCTIDTNGSVGCTGKVGADASVDGGARKVSLYAVQSPENWFEDFGSGTLASGAATITLDPTFAQTINTTTGYHVFLTPNGDCKGLYVSQKSAASFEVRELGGGGSSVAFDYRIVARRSGYENVRLTDVTEKYQRMEKQEQQRQERMAQHRAARSAAGPIAAAVVAQDR
jgi:hypothetical protein